MNQWSDEVPVATAAPLLRLALISILLVAAVAGALVASSPFVGWLTLGVAVIAGPVAVILDGRATARSAAASAPRARPEQPQAPEQERSTPRQAA